MYQIGDKIMYGSVGVCCVEDVAPLHEQGTQRLYYRLKPLYSSETIYVPVDAPVFMRPVLTRQEAESLIDRVPDIMGEIHFDSNLSALRQKYDACLRNHSCEAYFRLVKGIYHKGRRCRKLGQIDERYMKRAEDILYGELAVALGIPSDQVVTYIKSAVKGRKDVAACAN